MPRTSDRKRDKTLARKRMNERARADRRRSADAEARRVRTAPLSEVWPSERDFPSGKDVDDRLKKVSLRRVFARLQGDFPELVEDLRPLLAHVGRPPGLEACRRLTAALTLSAWREYADIPRFAPMVVVGPQKDIRVGHVGVEGDAVGNGPCVRYSDYNPVLFLAKTGKVGAVSYRQRALEGMSTFLAPEGRRTSALLLDAAHGAAIRREAVLDGDLIQPEPGAPARAAWDPAPFRRLADAAAAAVEALAPPEPVVKWRVERKDDRRRLLTDEKGAWRPFDTREEAEAAIPLVVDGDALGGAEPKPDGSWAAMETPVVTADVNPAAALRAKSDASAALARSRPLGPCAALECVASAAKALGRATGAWGQNRASAEAALAALGEAEAAAAGAPRTPSVAIWLDTGTLEPDGGRVHAKVGYLPLWMHEEKAHVVAEAFLPCGAPGTPEHGAPGMEAMGSAEATLAGLVAAYGSRATVAALVERGLDPLLVSRPGLGERATFVPLAGFVTSTEERLAGR
jgi:hypothetical protein